MKLFVWNDPYPIAYGGTIVYAVAETEDQARELAAKSKRASYGTIDEDSDMSGFKLGKPTRVCELPYAEWYYWAE